MCIKSDNWKVLELRFPSIYKQAEGNKCDTTFSYFAAGRILRIFTCPTYRQDVYSKKTIF